MGRLSTFMNGSVVALVAGRVPVVFERWQVFCHFKAMNFKPTCLLWAIVYFSEVVATPFCQLLKSVHFHCLQL